MASKIIRNAILDTKKVNLTNVLKLSKCPAFEPEAVGINDEKFDIKGFGADIMRTSVKSGNQGIVKSTSLS